MGTRMDWPRTVISPLVRQFAVCPQLSQAKMKCAPEGTALPTCLITAQGCASGSFVSLTTGGVQHQSEISDQTPSVRALQEPAATSGCTESLQHCLAVSQGTHKYWPLIKDLRTQGHINLGCTKTPISRARLLQWTYSSQHLLFQDKAAINAPFKFWL